jgi:phosphoribosyl-ATP pyrophosphohydrolase
MIELKNINLEGITQAEQIKKVYEEVDEFVQAVIKGDVTNSIEEFNDVVQASLGALQKMGLSADYVMSQYPKHLEKIKDRPRVKE